MAKVTATGSTAQKLKKPAYIIATLFTGAETDDSNPLGDTFVFEDIERDTTSVTQDENNSTDIERETSDTPIDNITSLGAWKVSAQLDDLQDDMLIAMMGFFKAKDGSVCAPAKYKDRFCRFDVVYEKPGEEEKYVAMRVPKLKLSSRVVLENLNTKLGNVTISGTAQNIKVKDADGKSVDTPFVKVPDYTLPIATT